MPVIVVVKADDVVLFQIFPILHFNDLERDPAGVFEAVFRGHRYVGAFVRMYVVNLVPVRDSGSA